MTRLAMKETREVREVQEEREAMAVQEEREVQEAREAEEARVESNGAAGEKPGNEAGEMPGAFCIRSRKGMEMVQVGILIAIAVAIGLIFKTQITDFVNGTFAGLSSF